MNGAALEPVTRQFVAALMAAGGPPIYTLSPADARALLAGQQSVFAAKPDARIEGATFPVGPKGAVRARTHAESGHSEPSRRHSRSLGLNRCPRRSGCKVREVAFPMASVKEH